MINTQLSFENENQRKSFTDWLTNGGFQFYQNATVDEAVANTLEIDRATNNLIFTRQSVMDLVSEPMTVEEELQEEKEVEEALNEHPTPKKRGRK